MYKNDPSDVGVEVDMRGEGRKRQDVGGSPRSYSHQTHSLQFEEEEESSGNSVVSFNNNEAPYGPRHSVQKTRTIPASHQQPARAYLSPSDYNINRMPDIPEKFRDEKDGSEIYVMDSAVKRPPGSIYSHYSGRAPSEMSSVKTKTSRKNGVVVETMSAPNPFCPHTKGVCCLLLLVNLGLILVTLGFSIVLQLFDPPYVWYFGVAFLVVGFLALISSLIFCVYLCRESEEERRKAGVEPGELYWTHHWQKRIPLPGFTSRESGKNDDVSTVYSARTDNNDKYYVRNEQREMTPIHSYGHRK